MFPIITSEMTSTIYDNRARHADGPTRSTTPRPAFLWNQRALRVR